MVGNNAGEAYFRQHRIAQLIELMLEDLVAHQPTDPLPHLAVFMLRQQQSPLAAGLDAVTALLDAAATPAAGAGAGAVSRDELEDCSLRVSALATRVEDAFRERIVADATALYHGLPLQREPPPGVDGSARLDELLQRAEQDDAGEVYAGFGERCRDLAEAAERSSAFVYLYDPVLRWIIYGNRNKLEHWHCATLEEVRERFRRMPPQAVERDIAVLRAIVSSPAHPVLTNFPSYRDGTRPLNSFIVQFPAWVAGRPAILAIGHSRLPPGNPEMLQLRTLWANTSTVTTAYHEDGRVALCNYQALSAICPHTTVLPLSPYSRQILPPTSASAPEAGGERLFLPHVPDRDHAAAILQRLRRGEQLTAERVRVLDKAKRLQWHLLAARQIEAMTRDGSFGKFHLVTEIDITAQVELEQERYRLLRNIFPQQIIPRLRVGDQVIADVYPHASLLFGDIVGFTAWSASIAVAQMVATLHRMISTFDEAARVLGVEKIKTIGDCYFCATGVPTAQPDHAERMLRFALAMVGSMCELRRSAEAAAADGVSGASAVANGSGLDMRIGIHSGAVVGGVIGKDKYVFDLWGDNVNTASRMESTGMPGRIQVSEQTHALLVDAAQSGTEGLASPRRHAPSDSLVGLALRVPLTKLTFTPRDVEAKGKGRLRAWLLDPRTVMAS